MNCSWGKPVIRTCFWEHLDNTQPQYNSCIIDYLAECCASAAGCVKPHTIKLQRGGSWTKIPCLETAYQSGSWA